MEQVKNFKIFLVDDDMFSLNLYEQHVRGLGYSDVHQFNNGTDCLNNLTQKPHVVFLDHNMEEITGFEVLKKIKRYDPNIYVVMISGQENMKTAVDALKYGAFDYLIKGDNETDKIADVLKRITKIGEALERLNPPIWKKILSFI